MPTVSYINRKRVEVWACWYSRRETLAKSHVFVRQPLVNSFDFFAYLRHPTGYLIQKSQPIDTTDMVPSSFSQLIDISSGLKSKNKIDFQKTNIINKSTTTCCLAETCESAWSNTCNGKERRCTCGREWFCDVDFLLKCVSMITHMRFSPIHLHQNDANASKPWVC